MVSFPVDHRTTTYQYLVVRRSFEHCLPGSCPSPDVSGWCCRPRLRPRSPPDSCYSPSPSTRWPAGRRAAGRRSWARSLPRHRSCRHWRWRATAKLEWKIPSFPNSACHNHVHMRPSKFYLTLFSWKFDTHPHPRNANNVEAYTFVALFPPGNLTPTQPPLRHVTLEVEGPYNSKYIYIYLLKLLPPSNVRCCRSKYDFVNVVSVTADYNRNILLRFKSRTDVTRFPKSGAHEAEPIVSKKQLIINQIESFFYFISI